VISSVKVQAHQRWGVLPELIPNNITTTMTTTTYKLFFEFSSLAAGVCPFSPNRMAVTLASVPAPLQVTVESTHIFHCFHICIHSQEQTTTHMLAVATDISSSGKQGLTLAIMCNRFLQQAAPDVRGVGDDVVAACGRLLSSFREQLNLGAQTLHAAGCC
jgi:hypothetical protein